LVLRTTARIGQWQMITPQEKARNVYGEAVEKLVWDSRVVSDGCGVIVGQQDNDERRLFRAKDE
jgi:hypothetical protein